jgi:hypothetical protein
VSDRPVVFVPLALSQVGFYVSLARELRDRGRRVGFLNLHEPSQAVIAAAGFPCENLYAHLPDSADASPAAAASVGARYGIPSIGRLLSHEKAAYEIDDSARLVRKLVSYLAATEIALDLLGGALGDPVEVVQELGGFVPVAAAFYVARRRGLRNTFAEPSFFRGRVFFTANSFAAPRVDVTAAGGAGPEVRAYLDDTTREKSIVIPTKDAHHYRAATAKVFSMRNVRRLVEKTAQKYLRDQQEEFSHIGGHVRRHLRMVVNGQRLARHYREIPDEPFVYYPLHVPADVALTIRSPEYFDQYALLDLLARTVPITHKVVFKEHPALVGAVPSARIGTLLARNDNVVLLRPWINNHDVMRRAAAVVTVNSKSGAEAIMLDRPVVVLGDAFYRGSGLVEVADGPADLEGALRRALAALPRKPEAIGRFFQAVWDQSYPGELFVNEPANCATFADSLTRVLAPAEVAVPAEAARVMGG